MPYFVYRVRPYAQLDGLAHFDSFAEASRAAKALRSQSKAEAGAARHRIKVIFAATALEAEDLLCEVREPGPVLGDD